VGQRRGLGLPGGGPKRYVVDVDVDRGTVVVGDDADQFDTEVELGAITWAADPVAGPVLVQCSAHGATRSGKLIGDRVVWDEPQRRVAPGQSVVLYDLTDTRVLAGAVATRPTRPSAHR
jgi:tRNA-specific 2-thiouridylase